MNIWEMGSEGISLIQLLQRMIQLMNFVVAVIKKLRFITKSTLLNTDSIRL
jgi:hypothetical protein